MAILYFSIIGFVIVLVDSLLYAVKNQFLVQKTRLTWLHSAFLLIFVTLVIAGFVAKLDYNSEMTKLLTESIISTVCTTRYYFFECFLAPNFVAYKLSLMGFAVAFIVLFCIFAILFHLNCKWSFEEEMKETDV